MKLNPRENSEKSVACVTRGTRPDVEFSKLKNIEKCHIYILKMLKKIIDKFVAIEQALKEIIVGNVDNKIISTYERETESDRI